jgi:hypothetical protein
MTAVYRFDSGIEVSARQSRRVEGAVGQLSGFKGDFIRPAHDVALNGWRRVRPVWATGLIRHVGRAWCLE